MSQVSGWKVEYGPTASDLEKALIVDHLVKKEQSTKIIKIGKHRIVERIVLKDFDIHAKTNFLHNIRAKIRRLLRPSKAELEFSVLRELENAGIKSLEPLGWAEQTRLFGPSVLFTRTLEDSETLEELWKKSWFSLDSKSKQIICKNFAFLLSQLHKSGLFHPDPHPGNILVIVQTLDLRIIDLHNPIRKNNPSINHRKEDISGWAQWGSLRLGTMDLARILRHYLVKSGLGDFKHWWKSLSNLTLAKQKRFWSRQEPLCLNSGHRRFTRVKGNGFEGIALSDNSLLLTKICQLFSHKGTPIYPLSVLKSSSTSQVYQTTCEGKSLIIKVIPQKKGIKGFLLSVIGADASKNQWYWSNALRLRLLPTPKILGWQRNTKAGWSFVLAEELSGALQLDRWLEGMGDNSAIKRTMINRLAKSVRTLHQRGIYNRDMKAANVMIDSENGINWVDLGGMGHLPKSENLRRFKDLARLAGSFWESSQITNGDRLRFLMAYLSSEESRKGKWKAHWKWIEKRALERISARVKAGRALG
jgi:serine/threonine protein kinase